MPAQSAIPRVRPKGLHRGADRGAVLVMIAGWAPRACPQGAARRGGSASRASASAGSGFGPVAGAGAFHECRCRGYAHHRCRVSTFAMTVSLKAASAQTGRSGGSRCKRQRRDRASGPTCAPQPSGKHVELQTAGPGDWSPRAPFTGPWPGTRRPRRPSARKPAGRSCGPSGLGRSVRTGCSLPSRPAGTQADDSTGTDVPMSWIRLTIAYGGNPADSWLIRR